MLLWDRVYGVQYMVHVTVFVIDAHNYVTRELLHL